MHARVRLKLEKINTKFYKKNSFETQIYKYYWYNLIDDYIFQ